MAKREKNPASDKTGNDTGVSLLVLGIVSVIFALWIPIVGIVLGTVSLVRVRKRNDLSGTVMAKAGKVFKHRGNMYSRCKLDSGNRPYIYDVSISMIRIA